MSRTAAGGTKRGASGSPPRSDLTTPTRSGKKTQRTVKLVEPSQSEGDPSQGSTPRKDVPPIPPGGEVDDPPLVPKADWSKHLWTAGSITSKYDTVKGNGAVEAFEWVCQQADPKTPRSKQPCPWAILFADCQRHRKGRCERCDAARLMSAPPSHLAASVEKVKQAATSTLQAKFTAPA